MKKMIRFIIGLTILYLIIFTSSCANSYPKTQYLPPPAIYLQHIEEPKLNKNTYHDLIIWSIQLKKALGASNQDKKALRAWVDKYLKKEENINLK